MKRSVEASVLDVDGWRKVRHTLLRCRRLGCSRRESTVWYNFYKVSNTNGDHCGEVSLHAFAELDGVLQHNAW